MQPTCRVSSPARAKVGIPWRAVRVFVWGSALGMLALALAGGLMLRAHAAGAAPVHPDWIERYQTYAHGRCHDYGLSPCTRRCGARPARASGIGRTPHRRWVG